MANRSYLINTSQQTGNFHELTRLGEADPQLFDIVEEAAYRIPLHWMLCFRSADARKYSVVRDTGGVWEYSAPCVSVAQALANLEAAWPLGEEIVADPEVAGALRRYTVSLLRSLPRPYLTMYVAEVVDGNDTALIDALAGSANAVPQLSEFADFEAESLPFDVEEWLNEDVEVATGETGCSPVTSGAITLAAVERPGIEPRWEKGWKRQRENALRWRTTHGRDATFALEFYCQHRERRDQYGYYYDLGSEALEPPRKAWESIDLELHLHALGRLGEFEWRGMEDGAVDTDLAAQAFSAQYTAEMIAAYRRSVNFLRFPDRALQGDTIDPTFTGLGTILGLQHQAFRLARLQLAESRKPGTSVLPPVHRFILRLLADFLGEEPPKEPTQGEHEPLLAQLADHWRAPDAMVLAPLCLAACDIHTRRTVYSGSKFHEFSNGEWTRIPVEVLLLFRLRQWLGLNNPEIDHPLMATPLGRLPSPVAFVLDEPVRRVRAAMAADGYDEILIFSGAYSGPDRDAIIARDREDAREQPSVVVAEVSRSVTRGKPPTIKRQGVRSGWSDEWNRTAISFAPDKEQLADDIGFLTAYANGQQVVEPYSVAPPMRSWEQGIGERLGRYAEAQLYDLERRSMAGEPFAAEHAANAFAARYLEQLTTMFSLHFKGLRTGDCQGEVMHYTDIPYTALGMILGFDEEAGRLLRLQLLMARRRCYAYHNGNGYPVFTFMLRLLADYLEAGPWIVESIEEAGDIFNPLFDLWRDPRAEVLTPLCLAACDYHTWETRREGFGTTEEFSNGKWTRTPIEILLLFDLRRRLGLSNPTLDHPLMQTQLAMLPNGSRPATDDLLQRVWTRMRKEGFDEQLLFELLHEKPALAAHRLPSDQDSGADDMAYRSAHGAAPCKPWWKVW